MYMLEMTSAVKWFLFMVTFAGVGGVSDEEIHRLPKLFHLDDYDRCLSREDGLYCVGTFELAPKTENSTFYSLIKEIQKEPYSFDRRLLHRGYCLSTRCPSKELDTTLRFEQCTNKHMQKYALTARLKKLSYCRNPTERMAKEAQAPDWPQKIFLYVIYLILFLNVLGTIYDLYADGKKNDLLVAWSLSSNWKQLTTTDGASSAFTLIQNFKILLHMIVIYAHATLMHFVAYAYNPEEMQKAGLSPMMISIRNGTALVQVFVLISSFLTAYNILVTARRSVVGVKLVARWILKRIFRIAPVYLLLTGYAATWWPRAGDGPMWSPIVEVESSICRRKFWSHVFFVNNLVKPTELCLVQSWAIAVDIQLFLVSLLLTILLLKLKVRAGPFLGALFAASCMFNVILAYAADLVPMVKVILPEIMHDVFRGSQSFFHLHLSPWSNLPACIFGLLMAHIYFEHKNKMKAKVDTLATNGFKYEGARDNENQVRKNDRQENEIKEENDELVLDNRIRNRKYLTEALETNKVEKVTKLDGREQKSNGVSSEKNESIKNTFGILNVLNWLFTNAHYFTMTTIFSWIFLGFYIKDVDSKPAIALYVGMERVMYSVTYGCHLMQIITVKGPWGRLMSWRGWTVPSRLLFSVVMVHWCIIANIIATRPQPVASSMFGISIDWLATLFYSFLAALPVSLLVEMPMRKVGDAILS